MAAIDIALSVNGRVVRGQVEPRTQLAEFLRDTLDLTGTRLGCEQGVCGACTVDVDGRPQRSCISYVGDADGGSVTTIEGFDDDALMAELRAAFTKHHGLQCGFCTSGMLITARDIILRLGEVAPARIREELSGNLCRCTGYVGIVEAVAEVSAGKPARPPPAPVAASRSADLAALPAAAASPAPEMPSRAPAGLGPYEPSQGAKPGWLSLEERREFAWPPETLWAWLSDVRRVVACLPGAEVTVLEGNHVEGCMRVALGPIKAAFRGEGQISLDEDRWVGRVTGHGRDAGSNVEGQIEWQVAPRPTDEGIASTLTIWLGWRITGPLAQFNRAGLVRDMVQHLTSLFVANLDAAIENRSGAPASTARLSLWSFIWSRLTRRRRS